MSKLCPKCQFCRGTMLSSTALILLGMEFTRAAQVVAGILFHSIMTSRSCWMLDMVLLHFPLEDAPHVLNMVQVWRHTWSLHHLQQQCICHPGVVFGVVVMLENSCWREGIIFYFRMSQYMLESMFPSMNRSSPVPAVVMQPQTMMLPPPLTVGKAQFSWYPSPGRRHTCWTPSESNKFTLDSSDHRTWPVINVLGQVVFNKLFAGFFVSQLQKRLPSGTTAM